MKVSSVLPLSNRVDGILGLLKLDKICELTNNSQILSS